LEVKMSMEDDDMTAACLYGVEKGKDLYRRRVEALEKALGGYVFLCETRDCVECATIRADPEEDQGKPCDVYLKAKAILEGKGNGAKAGSNRQD
jgi:hypothetical protein